MVLFSTGEMLPLCTLKLQVVLVEFFEVLLEFHHSEYKCNFFLRTLPVVYIFKLYSKTSTKNSRTAIPLNLYAFIALLLSIFFQTSR